MAKTKKKEKLNLELLVLCDYAIVSKDNKLSILGAFDQIFVNKTPARHAKMFVVGILEGSPSTSYSLRLKLMDPSGKNILPSQELKNTFGQNGRSNIIAEFGNLPIPLAGRYKVELSSNRKILGVREFKVIVGGGRGNGREKSPRYTN